MAIGNNQFIPDFAYKYVRPCGLQYCYFNLLQDLGAHREQYSRIHLEAEHSVKTDGF